MAVAVIRAGTPADLPSILAIQAASPQASQWPATDYLQYSLVVALCGTDVAGFAVWRPLGEEEFELLNLAVDPSYRRLGVGSQLLASLPEGRVFLEVRKSNTAGVAFYSRCGFTPIGVRRKYYQSPHEDGIVMELQK